MYDDTFFTYEFQVAYKLTMLVINTCSSHSYKENLVASADSIATVYLIKIV